MPTNTHAKLSRSFFSLYKSLVFIKMLRNSEKYAHNLDAINSFEIANTLRLTIAQLEAAGISNWIENQSRSKTNATERAELILLRRTEKRGKDRRQDQITLKFICNGWSHSINAFAEIQSNEQICPSFRCGITFFFCRWKCQYLRAKNSTHTFATFSSTIGYRVLSNKCRKTKRCEMEK